MTATNAPNTYAYFFANPTTMFVADANDGIQEWTLSSGTWSNVATLAGSYVGLTGVQIWQHRQPLCHHRHQCRSRPGKRQFAGQRHVHVQQRHDRHRHVWIDRRRWPPPAPTMASPASPSRRKLTNVVPVVTTSSSATAGSPVTVTVTAEYASGPNIGITDTGYTGTIAFTSSDPQAVLPANLHVYGRQ